VQFGLWAIEIRMAIFMIYIVFDKCRFMGFVFFLLNLKCCVLLGYLIQGWSSAPGGGGDFKKPLSRPSLASLVLMLLTANAFRHWSNGDKMASLQFYLLVSLTKSLASWSFFWGGGRGGRGAFITPIICGKSQY